MLPQTRLTVLPLLLAAVLAACGSKRPPTRIEQPDLHVEGTTLVLRLADGSERRGRRLEGAILEMSVEGGAPSQVRLASVRSDPQDADVLQYALEQKDAAGRWTPVCEPTIDGETWGFPVALPEGNPGREGAITWTCASGAVGKCIRWGYKPWTTGAHGEELAPLHAACVHMVRADYCGDGQPYTKKGTSIIYHDGIVHPAPPADEIDPDFVFEAGWSPAGAVCVAHTRWNDLVGLDQLRASCPRLAQMPACDEASATAAGALLFNASRLHPRLGR